MVIRNPAIPVIALVITMGFSGTLLKADDAAIASVVETPGLVAFWTFGESEDQPRVSTGTKNQHTLTEVNGPVKRVDGGPFSGFSAEFNGEQYFRIPHGDLKDLNISGPKAEVSMFAVVWIADAEKSRTIAGIWSEGKGAGDVTAGLGLAHLVKSRFGFDHLIFEIMRFPIAPFLGIHSPTVTQDSSSLTFVV